MTEEDFVSNRAKIYPYDFESDRASEILDCDDVESDESSVSSDYSDWTTDSSKRMWTPIPAKRARIRISNPVTLNKGLTLPDEGLRPSDLSTPVLPRVTPFNPQMGDEVIYFKQGTLHINLFFLSVASSAFVCNRSRTVRGCSESAETFRPSAAFVALVE